MMSLVQVMYNIIDFFVLFNTNGPNNIHERVRHSSNSKKVNEKKESKDGGIDQKDMVRSSGLFSCNPQCREDMLLIHNSRMDLLLITNPLSFHHNHPFLGLYEDSLLIFLSNSNTFFIIITAFDPK